MRKIVWHAKSILDYRMQHSCHDSTRRWRSKALFGLMVRLTLLAGNLWNILKVVASIGEWISASFVRCEPRQESDSTLVNVSINPYLEFNHVTFHFAIRLIRCPSL